MRVPNPCQEVGADSILFSNVVGASSVLMCEICGASSTYSYVHVNSRCKFRTSSKSYGCRFPYS